MCGPNENVIMIFLLYLDASTNSDDSGTSESAHIGLYVLVIVVIVLQIGLFVFLCRVVRVFKTRSTSTAPTTPSKSDHYISVYGSRAEERDDTVFSRNVATKNGKRSFELQPVSDMNRNASPGSNPIYDIATTNVPRSDQTSIPGMTLSESDETNMVINPSPRRVSHISSI